MFLTNPYLKNINSHIQKIYFLYKNFFSLEKKRINTIFLVFKKKDYLLSTLFVYTVSVYIFYKILDSIQRVFVEKIRKNLSDQLTFIDMKKDTQDKVQSYLKEIVSKGFDNFQYSMMSLEDLQKECASLRK
ncbi:MAG: hypothetical protein ACI86H_001289 [bacterium]|jgi:hypothetical protein